MLKVLIVEDEILARIGLRQLLDWEKLGFQLLPDAEDGEKALKLIEENNPDIILLDLNIPKVNGLQILKYLKNIHSSSKVIIVSCNEEFTMVKEAMKLGAYDYLRKLNLSAEELLRILQKIQAEKDDEAEQTDQKNPFMFQEISFEELIENTRDIFVNGGIGNTLLCIMPQKQESLYGIVEETKDFFKDKGQTFAHISKSNQCSYFILENKFGKSFYDSLHNRISFLSEGEVYFGINESPMRCNEDFNEAMMFVDQISIFCYYDEDPKIWELNEKINTNQHSPNGIHEMIDTLKESVDNFCLEDIRKCQKRIFQIIREEPYTNTNVLRRIFMDMLGIYSMAAQKFNCTIEEIEIQGSNCHYQNVMMMNSLNMIENWFREFQEEFYKNFYINYKCTKSALLKRAIEYIDAHLYSKISLSETAEEINVSGAHLSTVFKKEIGMNFIEYVNLKKVEAAKIMLKEGKLVYEVADILGFENVTYFSKVFKKYEDISPDAYRHLETEN